MMLSLVLVRVAILVDIYYGKIKEGVVQKWVWLS
jgi:hypothetical protein